MTTKTAQDICVGIVCDPKTTRGCSNGTVVNQFRSANYYDWTKEISEISSKFMKYIHCTKLAVSICSKTHRKFMFHSVSDF